MIPLRVHGVLGNLAVKRFAQRCDFRAEPIVPGVAAFGHAGGDAVGGEAEDRLRGFAPRFNWCLVVERQPGQPVDRMHPHPRQRQLRLHVGDHPHPRHGPTGVERGRPVRQVAGRHAQPPGRRGDVLGPGEHHVEQRIGVGLGSGSAHTLERCDGFARLTAAAPHILKPNPVTAEG